MQKLTFPHSSSGTGYVVTTKKTNNTSVGKTKGQESQITSPCEDPAGECADTTGSPAAAGHRLHMPLVSNWPHFFFPLDTFSLSSWICVQWLSFAGPTQAPSWAIRGGLILSPSPVDKKFTEHAHQHYTKGISSFHLTTFLCFHFPTDTHLILSHFQRRITSICTITLQFSKKKLRWQDPYL
jgi:hypothetical protein